MVVKLGRALLGIRRLPNSTFNPVFRGDVLFDDAPQSRAFIKDLDPQQLANELVTATIGLKLGLRLPTPGLVAISPEVSTEFRAIPHANGTDYIAFGSLDVGGATVAQLVGPSRAYGSMPSLRSSPWLGNLYGFDTWFANVDRNTNNILITGARRIFD